MTSKQKKRLKKYGKDHTIPVNGKKIFLFSHTQKGFHAWLDEFYDASTNNKISWKNESESCFEVGRTLFVNGFYLTKNEYSKLESIAAKVVTEQTQ